MPIIERNRQQPAYSAPRPTRPDWEVVSYRTLRRVVGALGVWLPIILGTWGCLLLGRPELEHSISDYYALRTRDALVGILFTIAWFLFTYRGYDKRDDRAGNVACVAALGVALFPITGGRLDVIVHVASATVLFAALAYFSWFLFTLSGGDVTPEKIIRNRIYRGCGVAIVACIALIGLDRAFLGGVAAVEQYAPVYWLETFALWAFGLSWFVKGETIFRDKVA